MDVEAMRAKYYPLVVTACEWRAIGVADPDEMAAQVFTRLDPRRDHGLKDLYPAIQQVVLAAYQRSSDNLSVMDRLRGGLVLSNRRTKSPADDFLAALSNLRRRDRDLLQLRFWDELDEDEAAEVLGLTIEEIRERMVQAGTRYLAKLSRSHPDLSYADVVNTIGSIKPGTHRRFG